jgi:two-component system, OmpR family, response regulator MprA
VDDVRDRPVVLVAEDDDDIRELLTFGLRREGYRVAAASDGLDALRAITAEQPDLVLLDITMPRLDGRAVCRILRAKGSEAPAVIFLTAAARTAERVAGLDLGAMDYVTKPFDPAELMARVRAALRTVRRLPRAASLVTPAPARPRPGEPSPGARSGATSNLRDVRPGLVS